MKHTMTFESGELTCAIVPGEFCRFLWTKKFGQLPWCHLFEVALADAGEPAGWVKRCEKCLALDSEKGPRP